MHWREGALKGFTGDGDHYWGALKGFLGDGAVRRFIEGVHWGEDALKRGCIGCGVSVGCRDKQQQRYNCVEGLLLPRASPPGPSALLRGVCLYSIPLGSSHSQLLRQDALSWSVPHTPALPPQPPLFSPPLIIKFSGALCGVAASQKGFL